MNPNKIAALAALQSEKTEESLWSCILAFQGEPFFTTSGLEYTYTVKRGRHGDFTGELLISRKEGSKTVTRSSVNLAFRKALEADGIVKGPKALGQIFGISYLYPMFYRFGLIQIPEKTARILQGEAEQLSFL